MAQRDVILRPRRRSSGQQALFYCSLAALLITITLFLRGIAQPKVIQVIEKPEVGQFDTISLPVPVAPIPAGSKLSNVEFKQLAFPRHQVPENAILTLENYLDHFALVSLPAGLPLYKENLVASRSPINPVVQRIPAGMRAMTIKVDATAAVEGWAGSGAIVDVLLVERDRTTVVAEQVKILSAERSVSPVDGAAAPSVPSTVTLLVTQEQCLAINTALTLGRIAFALRSTVDELSWKNREFTTDNLKYGSKVKSARISGYLKVKDKTGGTERSFALADDKWIKTEVLPEDLH
ncbi:MAG TPA: Flp pilus assembly protein CpaB [Oligoflexia bacterium]|nr:Flp pilus assembly protein CpaB [Oligoflexia bacterium]HMP26981.1 Flp pilus assembly protein CpaB [Oligoflexia bacterium]